MIDDLCLPYTMYRRAMAETLELLLSRLFLCLLSPLVQCTVRFSQPTLVVDYTIARWKQKHLLLGSSWQRFVLSVFLGGPGILAFRFCQFCQIMPVPPWR